MLYNGCVKQSKKSQVPKVIITYWKNSDEYEEEGENITISLYGLLVDYTYIMGDLNLDVMCI